MVSIYLHLKSSCSLGNQSATGRWRKSSWFPLICRCSDYINPIDLCNRLNAYIIPEAGVHAFLTFLFVINGYWLAIALNLPLLAFNAKKCVPSSPSLRTRLRALELGSDSLCRIYDNQHLLDATEIFRKLNVHKKVRLTIYVIRSGITDADLRALGILYQARFPPLDVLLLPLQHDCGPHPRRVSLIRRRDPGCHALWPALVTSRYPVSSEGGGEELFRAVLGCSCTP